MVASAYPSEGANASRRTKLNKGKLDERALGKLAARLPRGKRLIADANV
jgi:hypothetical protein